MLAFCFAIFAKLVASFIVAPNFFERSIKDRLGTQGISFSLVHQKVTNDFYKAYRNNIREGYGRNSWAFPTTTNIFRTKRQGRTL